jgi:hypothetical protein
VRQVFVSHTRRDKGFCDAFDTACARVGIKAFRSELETIPIPPWLTIKDEINRSVALFLLVGKELVSSQDSNDRTWRYTQNWIAYEIGIACQRNLDVWAVCDSVSINFPMPYLNNYLTVDLNHPDSFNFVRQVLEDYNAGRRFSVNPSLLPGNHLGKPQHDMSPLSMFCPYDDCGISFNLWNEMHAEEELPCPHCLRPMVFQEGHPVNFDR